MAKEPPTADRRNGAAASAELDSERFHVRRDLLVSQLGDIDHALAYWGEYEINEQRTLDERRPLPRPRATRPTLEQIRIVVVAALLDWDEAWERQSRGRSQTRSASVMRSPSRGRALYWLRRRRERGARRSAAPAP